jgi:hypothetical protein
VIAVHGNVEIGGRAQTACIEAVWLGPQVDEQLARALSRRYPAATIYRDQEKMLGDFPVTRLAGTALPRPGEMRLTRFRPGLWLLTALAAIASVLPSGPGSAGWPVLSMAALAFAAATITGAWLFRSWPLAGLGLISLTWLVTGIAMTSAEGSLYRCVLLVLASCVTVAWRWRGLPGRFPETRPFRPATSQR